VRERQVPLAGEVYQQIYGSPTYGRLIKIELVTRDRILATDLKTGKRIRIRPFSNDSFTLRRYPHRYRRVLTTRGNPSPSVPNGPRLH
jgi:hypothetical protein